MKKLFYLAAVAAMAVGMTSCSSDDENANANQIANLDINVDISGEESSRSFTEDKSTFATDDKIGVTILTASGQTTTTSAYSPARENIPYTKGSTDWTGAITLNNTTGYVYAYYPYSASISLTAQSIDITHDWMCGVGAAAVSSSSSATSITMRHVLAKIKVTIAKSSYTGTGNLTYLSVSSDGIYTKGTLNTLNGDVTMATAGGDKTFSWSGAKSLTTSQADVDTWMVVPIGGTTAKNITITATVDSKNYNATITGVTPSSGNFYTIPLTLSDKGLSLTAVTVSAWNTSTTSTGTLAP